ncbi:hypothetical protein FISHEDRAFT_75805 [Fistulina hepatica ATCC 64428]|uniref:Uncharacterized protein n=1 Tax=Fistulina hepatica ATCC 64428 TaxID=1128425 RepID=A0A0D7A8J6_9AGAR|nr:hypothetical protein FISHEDRAFT_75805 [Fistulina hepatica ATCC 64428]
MPSSQLARESGPSPSCLASPLPDTLQGCYSLIIFHVLQIIEIKRHLHELRTRQSKTPLPESSVTTTVASHHPQETDVDDGQSPSTPTATGDVDLAEGYTVHDSSPLPVTPSKEISTVDAIVYDTNTPEGRSKTRFGKVQRDEIIEFLLFKGRCAISYKRGVQLAHVLPYATPPFIVRIHVYSTAIPCADDVIGTYRARQIIQLKQFEEAWCIRPGCFNSNTHFNILEFNPEPHGLYDRHAFGLACRSNTMKALERDLKHPRPLVSRFSDTVPVDEQDAVREYLYIPLDQPNDIDDQHATIVRLKTEPDVEKEFQRAMDTHGNKDRGYVQACHLPKFTVTQSHTLVKPHQGLLKVYSKAHPVFIVYQLGKALYDIRLRNPDRNIENETRERFQGTDDEALIDEVVFSLRKAEKLFKKLVPNPNPPPEADEEGTPFPSQSVQQLNSDSPETDPLERSPYNTRSRKSREGLIFTDDESEDEKDDPGDEDDDPDDEGDNQEDDGDDERRDSRSDTDMSSDAESSMSSTQDLVPVLEVSEGAVDSGHSRLLRKRPLTFKPSASDLSDDTSSISDVSSSPSPPTKRSRRNIIEDFQATHSTNLWIKALLDKNSLDRIDAYKVVKAVSNEDACNYAKEASRKAEFKICSYLLLLGLYLQHFVSWYQSALNKQQEKFDRASAEMECSYKALKRTHQESERARERERLQFGLERARKSLNALNRNQNASASRIAYSFGTPFSNLSSSNFNGSANRITHSLNNRSTRSLNIHVAKWPTYKRKWLNSCSLCLFVHLGQRQECTMVVYLDDGFINMTRRYKKHQVFGK